MVEIFYFQFVTKCKYLCKYIVCFDLGKESNMQSLLTSWNFGSLLTLKLLLTQPGIIWQYFNWTFFSFSLAFELSHMLSYGIISVSYGWIVKFLLSIFGVNLSIKDLFKVIFRTNRSIQCNAYLNFKPKSITTIFWSKIGVNRNVYRCVGQNIDR